MIVNRRIAWYYIATQLRATAYLSLTGMNGCMEDRYAKKKKEI